MLQQVEKDAKEAKILLEQLWQQQQQASASIDISNVADVEFKAARPSGASSSFEYTAIAHDINGDGMHLCEWRDSSQKMCGKRITNGVLWMAAKALE